MRFQLPQKPESLNHIPFPYVNNLFEQLIDGKGEFSSYKTDNHPCQLIPALTYFNKIIAKL
jgi:hypothetical protein